jgi:nitrite reductase (NADH) large subunit
VPVTMLKVLGVDLVSIGRIDPAEGDVPIVLEHAAEHSYRRLVISESRIAGAILIAPDSPLLPTRSSAGNR